MLPLKF
jgi:hypothetical protein